MHFYHGEPPYDTLKDIPETEVSNQIRGQVLRSIADRKAKGRYSDHTIDAFGGEAFWRQSAGVFVFYLHYPSAPLEWINPAADYLCSNEFKVAWLKRSGVKGAIIADLHWAWFQLFKDQKKPSNSRQFAHDFFHPYASWLLDAVKTSHGILPDGRKVGKK